MIMNRFIQLFEGITPSHFRRQSALWLALGWLIATSPATWAHDPGLSIATAKVGPGTVAIHLAMARIDAEQIMPLDANHDGKVSESEFKSALPELERRAAGSYNVRSQNGQLSPSNIIVSRDDKDGVHFNLKYECSNGEALTIRSAWLGELARGHREYFSVVNEAGKVVSEKMLDAVHDNFSLTLETNTPAVIAQHSFREFLSLGLEHIATGYDHLLFLFGLLLVGGTLRSALKIITSFTVAHSITLALATLNIIHLPSKVVEPMIAASIVYVGVENLLRSNLDKRWLLTFCFGLIHGCGFASALSDLGVGANGTPIFVPLVSFNLGVEIGQLTIAALVLPIIWKCRSWPALVERMVPVGSTVVVVAGGYWLLQRTVL